MPKLKRDIVNHYATLEVREDSDEVDIKKAYRTLVLQWHPDKHRGDGRAVAEEKIRLINAAYEVLSNPTKKDVFDQQRGAMEGGQQAKKKQKVSPRVAIPKEFMMQPIGHPEKFLRYQGDKVLVEGRQDSDLDFNDFFVGTKFSLWWLPEVNNSCRIRALGSKAKKDKRGVEGGKAGGLNLAYKFHKDGGPEAKTSLMEAPRGQKNEAVNFIAVDSTVYEGSYRFEASSRRGCFLSFTAPDRLGVIQLDKDEDQSGVLDFMLVDFSAMSKFIDIEEVLAPAMADFITKWVPLPSLCEHAKVRSYFGKVLQKPVWDVEDFVSYFDGHWATWEYRKEDQCVRLRSTADKVAQLLRAAQSADEIASTIAKIGEELSCLTLTEVERVWSLLQKAGIEVRDGPGKERTQRRRAAVSRLASVLHTVVATALKDGVAELSAAQVLRLREQALTLAAPASGQPSRPPPAASLLADLALRATGSLASSELEALGPDSLVALALAATRLPLNQEPPRSETLGRVVQAAATRLCSWKAVDVIQLLLVSAKAKQDMPAEVKKALLKQAAEALRPQLKDLPSGEVLKLALAISSEGEPGAELLAVASREAVNRLSDFPQAQLLLLTQALTQGLGHQHEVVLQLLDFWTELLAEPEPGTAGSKGLSADQLVRLAQVATLASTSSEATEDAPTRLFEVLGTRLLACAQGMSSQGRSQLQAQLESEDGLAKFSGKEKLLKLLPEGACEKARDRSRSRRRR